MDAPDTAFRGQNTTASGRRYMALELGEKNWNLSRGDSQRAPSRPGGHIRHGDEDHRQSESRTSYLSLNATNPNDALTQLV
jgi:hypothetical protein